MTRTSHLIVASAVANGALAYLNTFPLVVWSSHSSSALNSLPSRLDNSQHTKSLLENILNLDETCDFDAVVIVEQQGLHASDLRSFSPDTYVARSLSTSPSSRQYPYLPSHSELDIAPVTDLVSSKCNSRVLRYSPGQSDITLAHETKHIICLKMPELNESGQKRKDAIVEYENRLGHELSTLELVFPKHLVVYIGSPLPTSLSKRQSPDLPDRPILDLSSGPLFQPAANTTFPIGGILKRYQLLTPGLITALLVAFFILLPLLFTGLTALASIQNPVRTDVSKSFNAMERKNQ